MKNTRLRQDDWVEAGFRALLNGGPQALKAEPLARALGTTKGSFYWHFKDVQAFHERMTAQWEEQALSGMIAEIKKQETPLASLHHFIQLIASDLTIEPAMRAWANSAPHVTIAVQQVDDARQTYLTLLLKQCGVGNPEIAQALYAAALGAQILTGGTPTSASGPLSTLVDLILALR
ncbi:TetR/AcrR family transcriptional regulator [Lentibacter sp.]|uniref:TetR/AcrR family transcriptional regulator n=1 Tax=Lentibacter sp. TaxID=2024994 RepID=UPI003F6CBD70